MLFLILTTVDSDEELDKVLYIYSECREDMLKLAYSDIGDMSDAEEIVSDILLWFAENSRKLPKMNKRNLKNYALSAVRNRAKNYIREKSRFESLDCTVVADNRNYFEELLDREYDISLLERVKACICRLEPIYYDMLSSVFIYGEPVKFVAKKYGIRYDTARKRLSRGIKILIEMLREEGVI